VINLVTRGYWAVVVVVNEVVEEYPLVSPIGAANVRRRVTVARKVPGLLGQDIAGEVVFENASMIDQLLVLPVSVAR